MSTSLKIVSAWAVTTTILSAVLLGYALGRAGAAPASQFADVAANTDPTQAAASVAPKFSVPESLARLPAEWRSEFDGKRLRGFAALFDVTTRRVIVEACRHRGYVDARSGASIEQGVDFCEPILSARLVALSETAATLVDKRGKTIELALSGAFEGSARSLTLRWDQHVATLVPGSKDDLFQAMDSSAQMVAQKDLYLRRSIALDNARRRVQQAGGDPSTAVVYSLPNVSAQAD